MSQADTLKKVAQMSEEEQMNTPLGHLFRCIVPLCMQRLITDPKTHYDVVQATMQFIDEYTYKIKSNGTMDQKSC
jgi:hypothetical protein